MIKLLRRFGKRYWFSFLLIIILLFGQANFDLKLPDYMSDIVNNGIQMSGITEEVPIAIRSELVEDIKLISNENEIKMIEDNYSLIQKGNPEYLEKYPELENQDIYLLNDPDNVNSDLGLVIGKKLMVVESIKTQGIPNLPEGTDFFETLENADPQSSAMMLEQLNSNLTKLDEEMITSASSVMIKNEYQALGINTDNIQYTYIFKTGFLMLLVAFGGMACAIAVSFIGARIAAKISKDVRGELFEKVENFSNTEFNKFSTASLITRSGNDITQIQMLIVMGSRFIFYAPILGIGALLNVINTDASMTWIIGLGLTCVLGLIGTMFVLVLPKFKIIQKLIDKVNLVSRESLTGLMVVRTFGSEDYEKKRFDKANLDLTKVQLFTNRAMALMMPTMNFIMSAITLLIVWVGSHQVDIGSIQVGDMMAFMQYAMSIIMSFLFITIVFIMMPRASVSAGRIMEVLETPLTVIDPINPTPENKEKVGEVEFRNVSFKYGEGDDYALQSISFIAKKGETTAIIGGTGSGKSTLVSLIPRLYDVTEGHIYVGGVDVREQKQKELRDKLGYVPQKGILFSGTIESNLKYGKLDASYEAVERAVEIAQATNVVAEKPEQYNEPIAQGGTNVSGGQKQRLSIARALVKNPDIFIFDDSFSALDFKTDANLRRALKQELGDKSLIIVAQRIGTIKDADQIIVLEDGMMVGIGTHKELMSSCEVYQEIAYSQLSKKELENV